MVMEPNKSIKLQCKQNKYKKFHWSYHGDCKQRSSALTHPIKKRVKRNKRLGDPDRSKQTSTHKASTAEIAKNNATKAEVHKRVSIKTPQKIFLSCKLILEKRNRVRSDWNRWWIRNRKTKYWQKKYRRLNWQLWRKKIKPNKAAYKEVVFSLFSF